MGIIIVVALVVVARLVMGARDVALVEETTTAVVEAAPAIFPPIAAPQPAPVKSIRFSVVAIEPNYTVTVGDTLSAIAQRTNTTVDAIVAINNLPDRSVTLNVGRRLILP